ncbi:hypothetical protein OO006_13815 [Prosthecochloris sp. SCSIO W1101]|uniref:hypothetical protein n=1 Tax=Prosthecochloris sp. SCSIO W1101 TaxID=2992242 RepID=UPI00223D8EC2|nr:hypothetical protein [Prosthecochloris sp. SCSIO W1101]UZJ41398.1 hypothetical protein OO006_13815 [Prosthecochloris sp. SCSIO W1101]
MLSSLSKLSDEQLQEVRALEKSIGKTLLSYSSYNVVADDLTEQELLQVRELEKKLGTALVVVRESGAES